MNANPYEILESRGDGTSVAPLIGMSSESILAQAIADQPTALMGVTRLLKLRTERS